MHKQSCFSLVQVKTKNKKIGKKILHILIQHNFQSKQLQNMSSKKGESPSVGSKTGEAAPSIGSIVRVSQSDNTMRTATVAYINDDRTIDLIYTSNSSNADGLSISSLSDEENNVHPSRIVLLNDFEETTPSSPSPSTSSPISNESRVSRAERIKDEAAVLFSLKDFEAAYLKYKSALHILYSTDKPCVGSTVLVREKGKKEFAFQFVAALVSIVDETLKTVDVMYANKKEEEEEEDDVGYDRIHVLPPQTLSLSAPLQCTLHLNCGVCNLKLKRYTLAIEHASLAVAIAKFSHSKESTIGVAKKTGDAATADVEIWVKGFWIRGKAQVALNHFKEARADARRILKLPNHENNEKAIKLLLLIEKREKITHKKDVKLIKAISSHIGVAMDKGNGGGGGGKSGDGDRGNNDAGGKTSSQYSHK